MQTLPRLAIGSLQERADHRLASWGLMALLSRIGLEVQPYHPRSAFSPSAAATATGRDPRHLDPWQMNRRLCEELLADVGGECDLAILEGRFTPSARGNLDRLCDWLRIPKIAVLDVTLPRNAATWRRLGDFDAVLLDRVTDAQAAARWAVDVETLFPGKVLGWLPDWPGLREPLRRAPQDESSLAWCQLMAGEIAQRCRIDRILQLAQDAPPMRSAKPIDHCRNASTIALAFDEAFHCYFPDTLDRMEAAGARIRAFSPLRCETIPCDADLVVFGCGNLAAHADRLAENRCLQQSLIAHKASGKRIYAEGAGAAFLCRQLVLDDGRQIPMSGLLPATALNCSSRRCMQPLETHWRSPLWLGGSTQRVRGYRNSNWRFEAPGLDPTQPLDTITEGNVIGTRVHVNFAAHPRLLADFVQPLCSACPAG